MNEAERLLKVEFICRTCLTESNELLPIFMDEGDDIITKMLELCSGLNIKLLDGFPTNICSNCLNKVRLAYQFRLQCENSRAKWLKLSNSNIDLEIEDERNITGLRNDLKIYKCEKCPNQYTMLVLLHEHCSIKHPDEICAVEPDGYNYNGICDVSESGQNTVSRANDLIIDGNKDKCAPEHCVKEHLYEICKPEPIDDNLSNGICGEFEVNEDLGVDNLILNSNEENVSCLNLKEPSAADAEHRGNKSRESPSYNLWNKRFQKKKLICDHCSKSYSTKFNLNRHLQHTHGIVHKRNNSTEFCKMCRRQFSSEKNLLIHMALKHPPNEWADG